MDPPAKEQANAQNDAQSLPAATAVVVETAPTQPPASASTAADSSQQQQPSQRRDEQEEVAQSQRPVAQPSNQPANSQQHTAVRPPSRVMARDRYNHQSLGPSLNSTVKQARVLMVGAGGIGCELLKNIVLSGFAEIHIVDLDTIDLSNLNRQFLFRQEHIKKSKALVAKEAAEKFNPNVKIVAHHANIKDNEFTVSWFRRFSIVFNALDNLDARRHVNKMCLAANVALIESGTTGFNGQVQVIKKGVTACYDCTPKEAPKSFPVCTIRSTPSQPIHCIVWAKSYLLNEIFGVSEDGSAFDHSDDAENAHEIEELKKESEALKKIRSAVGTDDFPRMLFDKIFHTDIERLKSVDDMWKSRQRPESLKYETVFTQATEVVASRDEILANDQRVWSLEENLVVFKDSLGRLSHRMLELKNAKNTTGTEPIITFDKDDVDTLDFVASSANIRSTIFGIDRKSRFEIKEMAGNIIPAIATTNAIVAGLCVLEAFKVLKGDYNQAKEVFLTPFGAARLLAPDTSRAPNLECPVCGVFNASIKVDLARATLNDVVENIIRKKLGYGDKEFVLNNEVGIVYDADETDNLSKKLSDLRIRGGSFLTVIDEDDEEPLINVVLDVEESTETNGDEPVRAEFNETPKIPRKAKKAAAHNGETNGFQQNGTNGSQLAQGAESKGVKRSYPDDDSPPAKKAKTMTGDDDDIVVIQDAGGAIVIEDD
ncbi:Molybdenum cofactor biosynthesis, MoeB [Moelleriella libera RCEF 2490]|uniref:Molybdenum cofactor biosynthesis, MoeB n=1 Tax=Moelleriella libera RCEF 2490 TaxID=1081109 RepID=A0A162IUB8_9HYPO|nr:Molybdenum cofactor biosynthesis, MoeB [Moelleriella libera RCEF 2490]